MEEIEFSIPVEWKDLRARVIQAQEGNRAVKLKFNPHRLKNHAVEQVRGFGTLIIKDALDALASLGYAQMEPEVELNCVVVVLLPWNSSL